MFRTGSASKAYRLLVHALEGIALGCQGANKLRRLLVSITTETYHQESHIGFFPNLRCQFRSDEMGQKGNSRPQGSGETEAIIVQFRLFLL